MNNKWLCLGCRIAQASLVLFALFASLAVANGVRADSAALTDAPLLAHHDGVHGLAAKPVSDSNVEFFALAPLSLAPTALRGCKPLALVRAEGSAFVACSVLTVAPKTSPPSLG